MKVQVFRCNVAVLLFFLFLFCSLKAQENPKGLTPAGARVSPGNSSDDKDPYAHIFIGYPLARSGSGFSVFLNKKNIGKLTNGGRIECRLLLDGPIAITLIDGNVYSEPRTQSKNTRTISIKKGKSYYFRVNGSAGLEYNFNPGAGEKNFTDSKEFIAQPAAFTETSAGAIPQLTNSGN